MALQRSSIPKTLQELTSISLSAFHWLSFYCGILLIKWGLNWHVKSLDRRETNAYALPWMLSIFLPMFIILRYLF